MGSTRLKRWLSSRLLAASVGVLVLATPLLGWNCEIACARDVTRTARVDGERPPAEHCASHRDGSSGRTSGSPANPDRCGHRADFVAVKKVVDVATPRFGTSSLAVIVRAWTACEIDRSAGAASSLREAAAPLSIAARPSVLRL